MGRDWSRVECEAIVADYFELLLMELRGETFNKAERRRSLSLKLNNRSDGSVQYKYRNIAAVLNELDWTYVDGYKPAYNYQGLLRDIVLAHMSRASKIVETATDRVISLEPPALHIADWHSAITEPPKFDVNIEQRAKRVFEPVSSYSVSNKEEANKTLGRKGEEFVIKLERNRLEMAGRRDLAKEVVWTSEEHGDGAGYDIRSFDLKNERERFIEARILIASATLLNYEANFISS